MPGVHSILKKNQDSPPFPAKSVYNLFWSKFYSFLPLFSTSSCCGSKISWFPDDTQCVLYLQLYEDELFSKTENPLKKFYSPAGSIRPDSRTTPCPKVSKSPIMKICKKRFFFNR